jgi:hypothetical protein
MDPHGRIGPYRAYGVGYSAGRHLPILEHNERITDNLVHISRAAGSCTSWLCRRPIEMMGRTPSPNASALRRESRE